MKIQAAHFNRLKEGYQKAMAYGEQGVIESYETGRFSNSERAKGTESLQARFIWDIFWCITGHDKTLLNELYTYLEDQHIFTAMKRIVPSITMRYEVAL